MSIFSRGPRPAAFFSNDNRLEAPPPASHFSKRQMRCPQCDHPAVAPAVSTYLQDGAVESGWICGHCGFAWSSSFPGLST